MLSGLLRTLRLVPPLTHTRRNGRSLSSQAGHWCMSLNSSVLQGNLPILHGTRHRLDRFFPLMSWYPVPSPAMRSCILSPLQPRHFILLKSRILHEYDNYYVDRHGDKPLPVLFLRLDDPGHCFFYINPEDATVISSFDSMRRWSRWLYHGLHSLDVPLLYRARPLWDIIIIVSLLTGVALSFTAIILAARRFRLRAFASMKQAQLAALQSTAASEKRSN